MSNLHATIEKAASAFSRSIIAAVKDSTLQELLALSGAPAASPARKRGRPPKSAAVPGRKPGRPPKVVAEKPTKKVTKKTTKKITKATPVKKTLKAAKPAKKKRHINYPKCSVPGCGKNRYARGGGMCGEHYKASQEK
ncbi:MAG: hypothetical protein M0R80_29230 [Proteobacteria bacterium]|jgi:hypothetical protein|nr:hypothetical protein [Pseudomonadota bacterium]